MFSVFSFFEQNNFTFFLTLQSAHVFPHFAINLLHAIHHVSSWYVKYCLRQFKSEQNTENRTNNYINQNVQSVNKAKWRCVFNHIFCWWLFPLHLLQAYECRSQWILSALKHKLHDWKLTTDNIRHGGLGTHIVFGRRTE